METSSIIALIMLTLIVAGVVFYLLFWPGLRRRRILARPFPEVWLEIVRRRLSFFDRLDTGQQQRLQQLINLFLADKRFVGCAGQVINDEIRLTIAAQACLLVLQHNREPYPELRSVLVYPSSFVVNHERRNEFGLVSRQHTALLGESWDNGKVILAWDNVEQGICNLHDGYNVVLHEFAHQLDSESGATNGAPRLRHGQDYASWAEVFQHEYERLQHDAEHHHHSLMDIYGATNPAEFFAVATETFFERPREMAAEHRELYEQLAEFYQLKPAQWWI